MNAKDLRTHRPFLTIACLLLVLVIAFACNGDSSSTGTGTDSEIDNNIVSPPVKVVDLNLIISSGGSATADCSSSCSGEPGWVTSVVAYPNMGYEFVQWQCTGSCPPGIDNTNARTTLTILQDTHLVPVFQQALGSQQVVGLTLATSSGGSAVADCNPNCIGEPGWTATIETMANPGLQLLGYSCFGDGCPNTIPDTEVLNIVVNGDIILTPIFGEASETTLAIITAENGSASINNNGCDSTRTCTDQPGWTATVEATANTGFQLLRYSCSGDGCPNTIPNTERLSLTVDRDITLTPVFGEIPEATLAIGTAENGSASINNNGCDSTRTCTDQPGWTATVEATANTGFQLLSYSCSGDGCPNTIPNTERLSLTVDGDITLTPVFGETPEAALTIGAAENGRAGINNDGCESTRTCTDQTGWTATVEATANTGFQLLRYSCSGDGCPRTIPNTERLSITVNGDIILTPVFGEIPETALTPVFVEIPEKTLTPVFGETPEATLTIGTAEGGGASINNDGCESTRTCTDQTGWTATVEATANTGFQLLRYSCSGDGCPNTIPNTERLSITVNRDITLTPVFGEIPETTLTIGTAEDGSVSITNVSCDSTSTCTDQPGWTATVEATANTGFQLLRYSCSGDGCPNTIPNTERLSLTVNGDIILTPVFGEIPEATLTIGTAEGGSASAGCGSDCEREIPWNTTITAIANDGYEFVEWECIEGSCPSGSLSQSSISVTVNEDTQLRPSFQMVESTQPPSFQTTRSTYSETENWNTIVSNDFGSSYQVADWSDLVEYHDDGGDILSTVMGLSNLTRDPNRPLNDIGNALAQFYVTHDGDRIWSGNRHYFAALFEQSIPGFFLAHNSIRLQGHVLALGSWYGLDLPVLATLSQATTPTPSPSTTTTSPFQTTSNTYSETENWNTIVSNDFGSSYRVVDWSDLVEYHDDGGDLLQTINGLSNIVPGEADPAVRNRYPADNPVTSFYVTYNDSRNSGSRYYFASLYKDEVRGGFAVVERINLQGYVLALGSYFNLDLPVLVISS